MNGNPGGGPFDCNPLGYANSHHAEMLKAQEAASANGLLQGVYLKAKPATTGALSSALDLLNRRALELREAVLAGEAAKDELATVEGMLKAAGVMPIDQVKP